MEINELNELLKVISNSELKIICKSGKYYFGVFDSIIGNKFLVLYNKKFDRSAVLEIDGIGQIEQIEKIKGEEIKENG